MKLLVVLLAIATTAMGSDDDTKCIPLATFMEDCNMCHCSVDGTSADCTLRACYPHRGFVTYLRIPENTTPATTRVCKPRTYFKNRCNWCQCSEDGTTYDCTKIECGAEVWNLDGTLTVLPASQRVTRSVTKQVCEPFSTFKNYCNTCGCAADGMSYACTRMACDKNIWNLDGTLKVTPHSNRVTRSVSKQVCQPRTTFKNYCNSCTCSADGTTYACTRMACDTDIWNRDGSLKITPRSNRVTRSICQPHSTFKDYCNTCTCSSDGRTYACTKMACDLDIWNPNDSLKITPYFNRVTISVNKQVCQPFTVFKDYCNTCGCAADGMSYACTRMACDKDIWNPDGSLKTTPNSNRVTRSTSKQVCEPFSQFKNYCNTCGCAADGMSYACTRMMCDKEIWNPDGSLKIIPKSHGRVGRSAPKQVCQPLAQFKDYCNTCGCAADGLSYACTRMMCDKSIWNKDGSLKPHAQNLLSTSEKTCEPGTTFSPDECNTCFCNEEGTSQCTLKLCLTHYTEPMKGH